MGYLVNPPIERYSKRLDLVELQSLSSGIQCFPGNIFFNKIFLGAKFQIFNDSLSNFTFMVIDLIGTNQSLGQYSEMNGTIGNGDYVLFGSLVNSTTAFGYNSANAPAQPVGLRTNSNPLVSDPNAYAIFTIYLTQ
jgi:hypothetical protein